MTDASDTVSANLKKLLLNNVRMSEREARNRHLVTSAVDGRREMWIPGDVDSGRCGCREM